MLLQALRVEIEMKNLNLQVTFLVKKGVGTLFLRFPTPLHPWSYETINHCPLSRHPCKPTSWLITFAHLVLLCRLMCLRTLLG